MEVIVDANVPIVASGLSPQADAACVNSSTQRLAAIMKSGRLLLDEDGLILREYTSNLGFAGQPGAGEKFVKWAHSNQENRKWVRKVAITKATDGRWRKFLEFPDSKALEDFDKSDQKFAAVAIASGNKPPILNAVDSDWWHHEIALVAFGIRVEFLCPQHKPV